MEIEQTSPPTTSRLCADETQPKVRWKALRVAMWEWMKPKMWKDVRNSRTELNLNGRGIAFPSFCCEE